MRPARGPAFACTLVLVSAAVLHAAADPTFVLETRSLRPYTPAYLGNGQVGIATSPLATKPSQCFMAGVYDHAPGDVPRIALIPAWNAVDVHNGRIWLNSVPAAAVVVHDYHQALDMYEGALHTQYEWADGKRTIRVHLEHFVSRADPGLGAVRLKLTPEFAGTVRVRLGLSAWPPPNRLPLEKLEKLEGEAATNQWRTWYPGHMVVRSRKSAAQAGGGLVQMLSQAEGTATMLGEAAALAWPAKLDGVAVRAVETETQAALEVSFTALAGRTYMFETFTALVPSFKGGNPLETAVESAEAEARRGWLTAYDAHTKAWRDLWDSDIVTEGDPELQRIIHSMLFYLLGSARAGSEFSVPPMGLSTSGYYGHVFWDADTYMFPPLLLLHPEIGRTIVEFRNRTLEAARANARKNGYQGAMYPWEAGTDGVETTPRFAYQNALYENHVNGDVALAQWWYYLATGDREWLAQSGYPVIRDTADFWVSRVKFNPSKARYEIGGVVSVNESLIGVSNDPYTNAAAKKNLDLAISAAAVLGQTANPKWAEVSGKLWLPRTDMMLIDYPLEFPLTLLQKRRMARQAMSRPPRGAMMGVEFFPILGAELQERRIIDALLPRTWRPYVRPPFNALPETPTNNNINFITGAGAFLQQFLFGYTGLRLSEQGLSPKYPAILPSSVKRLVLKGVTVRGARRDIIVENGHVR